MKEEEIYLCFSSSAKKKKKPVAIQQKHFAAGVYAIENCTTKNWQFHSLLLNNLNFKTINKKSNFFSI